MVIDMCHFCEEESEIGKNIFWCPRLRNYKNGLTYYGDWVCLKCCSHQFFKNIHDKHLSRSWMGSCAECDFPIGAILEAKEWYGVPENSEICVRKFNERYVLAPSLSYGNRYYGYKWDIHQKRLKLVERCLSEGIVSLVLKKGKLPTRKVILLEDTLSYDPLSWGELNRYYWKACGYKQHFKKEAWMDRSPVIICAGYLNEQGFNFDDNFKKKIEYLTEQLKKRKE